MWYKWRIWSYSSWMCGCCHIAYHCKTQGSYLCFCPAEGTYFIGAATCNVACCQFLCLSWGWGAARCQWVHIGLVLFGVGRCNAGMPGYTICPAAEWLLVRHQPLLLKLHHQFWSCVCYTNGVDSLLAWAGDGDAWEAWFWWVDNHWKLLKQIRGVV